MRIDRLPLIHRPPEIVFGFFADERHTYDPTTGRTGLLTGEPLGAPPVPHRDPAATDLMPALFARRQTAAIWADLGNYLG